MLQYNPCKHKLTNITIENSPTTFRSYALRCLYLCEKICDAVLQCIAFYIDNMAESIKTALTEEAKRNRGQRFDTARYSINTCDLSGILFQRIIAFIRLCERIVQQPYTPIGFRPLLWTSFITTTVLFPSIATAMSISIQAC